TKVPSRYDKFKNQHIDKDMSPEKCDKVISEKGIKDAKTNCKNINTFILATIDEVKPICGSAGEPYKDKGLTLSTKPFKIVVCKLQPQGDCKYNGQSLTKRIVIACEKDFPVHYDHDIDYIDINKI
uniref:Ribonuclease A-domain domain-containing protein n=1 Tax=Monopterus albus TaxID=43700 RepID=A0A3Q3K5K8_MONAL